MSKTRKIRRARKRAEYLATLNKTLETEWHYERTQKKEARIQLSECKSELDYLLETIKDVFGPNSLLLPPELVKTAGMPVVRIPVSSRQWLATPMDRPPADDRITVIDLTRWIARMERENPVLVKKARYLVHLECSTGAGVSYALPMDIDKRVFTTKTGQRKIANMIAAEMSNYFARNNQCD